MILVQFADVQHDKGSILLLNKQVASFPRVCFLLEGNARFAF